MYSFLKEKKSDIAIIHIGCNNINLRIVKNINTTKLAESSINVANICRNNDIPEITISGVLFKKSLQLTAIIRQVNDLWCDMCK